MTLTLYFIRHGQTSCSRANLYCGSIDPELTEEGQQMAEAFAEVYKNRSWEAIYASPTKRAIATVKPLCHAIAMEPQLREGLGEIKYGKWDGETVETVKQMYPDEYVRWLTEPAWNPPTGGETATQVANRASLVITEILQKHHSGNVLIASHKGTIRIAICSLMGIDIGRFRDRIAAPVASVSVVKFSEHGPLLEELGNRSHLSEYLQTLPGT